MVKGITTLTLVLCASIVTVLADSGNQNCQVTTWGPWLPCDPLTYTKARYRRVEVAPTGNGRACPVLTEKVACGPTAQVLVSEEANVATSPLTLPSFNDHVGPRADAIAQMATQISNGARYLQLRGNPAAYFPGPALGVQGSLLDQIGMTEVMHLMQYQASPQLIAALQQFASAPFTSMQAIANAYSVSPSLGFEVPMSTDNSDATFGRQRITCKSFMLRIVQPLDFVSPAFTITAAQATQRCGADIPTLITNQKLYVENFSTIGQWNDPNQPQKYMPNSIAFYCFNQNLRQMLPIEIRLLDTGLTYTPFDSANDWTLAKMAVEAASNGFHSVYHMIATHGLMIPVRVELVRNMAQNHPVRALLERHSQVDMGLERLAISLLFNSSTALDVTYGAGADGALRLMYRMATKRLFLSNTFKQDMTNRGLDLLGADHPYAYYASQYWTVIDTFIGRYLDAYYASDAAVSSDFELQNWVVACTKVSQLRDFPTTISSKGVLRSLIVHLVFTNTITHHGMNGAVTWMGMGAPYSPAALWKPLPTAKNTALNLMDYTTPLRLLPTYVCLVSYFARPVPTNENFLNAYTVSPFKDEVVLQSAINDFNSGLQAIETLITNREQGQSWPFMALKPSRTSFHSWI